MEWTINLKNNCHTTVHSPYKIKYKFVIVIITFGVLVQLENDSEKKNHMLKRLEAIIAESIQKQNYDLRNLKEIYSLLGAITINYNIHTFVIKNQETADASTIMQ